MSGGSYDYLYLTDSLDRLLRRRQHLLAMADRLDGVDLPEPHPAAVRTRRLVADLEAFEDRFQADVKALADVWQAVEWCDSYDWSWDQVVEALDAYELNHRKAKLMTDRPAPVPTRLGADWVALCAAHAKVRALTEGKDPGDDDAVTDAHQALAAIDEAVAALDAYQALLSILHGNLHSFIAHREAGL